MRQIRTCLPLVLSGVLGSAMLVGQQAPPATAHASTAANAAKRSSAPTTSRRTAHSIVKKRHARGAAHKGAKRPEYRPLYSENSVEVINGDATKKVVFHDDQAATTPEKKPAGMKSEPAPMKVEVVNGSSTDTQYFYDNGQDNQTESARNQTVVIGIQSSDTRVVGGNKHPVVTSVTSSSANDAKTAGSGEHPVMKSVSPHPKRPVYQPDAN